MKTLLIIIAVVVLIPAGLLIFILLNPPNTLDKDCEARETIPSKPIKLGEGTVKIIAIVGSFFLGLLALGFVWFVIWFANNHQF